MRRALFQRIPLIWRLSAVLTLFLLVSMLSLSMISIASLQVSLQQQLEKRAFAQALLVLQQPMFNFAHVEDVNPMLLRNFAEQMEDGEVYAALVIQQGKIVLHYPESHDPFRVYKEINDLTLDEQSVWERHFYSVAHAVAQISEGNEKRQIWVALRDTDLHHALGNFDQELTLVVVFSLVASLLVAWRTAVWVKSALFNLEPYQIAEKFEAQNATLMAVHEGIIQVNRFGVILTQNPSATQALQGVHLVGLSVSCFKSDAIDWPLLLKQPIPLSNVVAQYLQQRLVLNIEPMFIAEQFEGLVLSLRLWDELESVSEQLHFMQRYTSLLRSQTHEYQNKLHTLSGMLQLGATDEALALIEQEQAGYQNLLQLLLRAVPDPAIAGLLLGKYNRACELGIKFDIDEESQFADIPEHISVEHLNLIIGNLLDNAFEASLAAEPVQGKVELSLTDIGDSLVIEVENNGASVDESQVERLFERGVSSKSGTGRGYGLYLLKGTLEQYGGEVYLRALQPSGTLASVFIPK